MYLRFKAHRYIIKETVSFSWNLGIQCPEWRYPPNRIRGTVPPEWRFKNARNTHNQEETLRVFLNDGEVPLDNNVTEGALRSFCLHKHAWKLIDSIDGAKSSAIIYSITETAKANNLNPFRYLAHVLTVLKDHLDDTDYSFIEELLPWSDQLPEICRSKSKSTNV